MVTYMDHENYCGPNNQLRYITRNMRRMPKWARRKEWSSF